MDKMSYLQIKNCLLYCKHVRVISIFGKGKMHYSTVAPSFAFRASEGGQLVWGCLILRDRVIAY